MASSGEAAEFPTPPEDFLIYRSNRVVAILDDPDSVERAISDLVDAGFPKDEVHVLSGRDGLAKLDVTGRHHGLRGGIYRFVEHLLGDEHQWLHEHSDHLARGGYGIAVTADKDSKDRAVEVLTRHGAHDAAYFDELTWHRL